MSNAALSKFNPFNCFNRSKTLKSNTAIFMAALTLSLNFSCRYYKVSPVSTTPETMGQTIDDFNKNNKYVIINSGSNAFHLESVIVNIDNETITGKVAALDSRHMYKKARKSRTNRYKPSQQSPMDEVHFDLKTESNFIIGNTVTIPFSDIHSISLNEKDGAAQFGSIMLGTIGVLAGITLIALALKSSCPFVYIKNGDTYTFVGDLYPGVITKNIQRDDYLHLSEFEPANNEYILKITNELKEVQHTDLLELITIDHESHSKVLLDKNGNIHTFSNLESPSNVTLDDRTNSISPALKKDLNFYNFGTNRDNAKLTSHVILEFDKIEETKNAKLFLTLKNSIWLDFVYGKFNEQFGTYFNSFQQEIQNDPAEKSMNWTNNQHIPLSVYKETNSGWELVDRINPLGSLSQRDVVIPLELSNILEDKVTLKLETGFMFWELDYAAIDYSRNTPVKVSYATPQSVIDQDNNDVTYLLTEADQNYHIQREIGNEIEVIFESPESKDPSLNERTVFLKNRGYYIYIRDYDGIPDEKLLKSFEENEAFTQFAIDKYFELISSEEELIHNSI